MTLNERIQLEISMQNELERFSMREYTAVCGNEVKIMRQYADQLTTSMRQYAELQQRLCGSIRIEQ